MGILRLALYTVAVLLGGSTEASLIVAVLLGGHTEASIIYCGSVARWEY